MSFLSKKYATLTPYIPGEQPQNRDYIKLNTNESPFAPTPLIAKIGNRQKRKLNLYPDPENSQLCAEYANYLGVDAKNIFAGNGSDEVLAFIFAAFFDNDNKVSFPDITYGFYPVYCSLFNIPYQTIPLTADFDIDIDAFCASESAIVIANPNAPTGIALNYEDITKLLSSKPSRLVIIDEAYIDFGGQSAVPLINKYNNLIVCHTFSKSRSLAGARIGFAIASEQLIADIKAIKYSFNSYNVNRFSEQCGIYAIKDTKYFEKNCKQIIENRNYLCNQLSTIGFKTLASSANFVLTKHSKIGGADIYQKLKERGILVRHFNTDRLRDYVRITIGSKSDMEKLVAQIKQILEEI